MKKTGFLINRFYSLKLEFDKITALKLSWTLVHNINEDSPLFGFNEEDFKKNKGEIIVYLKAFDELFSNTVSVRSSYSFDEVVYGAKFNLMYKNFENNSKTILELNKINDFELIILK